VTPSQKPTSRNGFCTEVVLAIAVGTMGDVLGLCMPESR
jgi:hypothetical protein